MKFITFTDADKVDYVLSIRETNSTEIRIIAFRIVQVISLSLIGIFQILTNRFSNLLYCY